MKSGSLTFGARLFDLLTGDIFTAKTKRPRALDFEQVFYGQSDEENVVRGENNIHYNADLIGLLEKQHKALFELYAEIGENVSAGLGGEEISFKLAHKNLNKFLLLLRQHVVIENLRLYGYLKKMDPDNDVGKLQADMRNIQRVVTKFAEGYITLGITKGNAADFLETWEGRKGGDAEARLSRQECIGAVLTERVKLEEDGLYATYTQIGEENA